MTQPSSDFEVSDIGTARKLKYAEALADAARNLLFNQTRDRRELEAELTAALLKYKGFA